MGKSDKWRLLLKDAELLAEQRLQDLNLLLKERDALKAKEQVLEQVTEGLTTVARLMAICPYFKGSLEQALLEDTVTSLLELESRIQQQAFGIRSSPAFSEYSRKFLHKAFDPVYAQQVLSMTDGQIIARFRELAGDCAIYLTQGAQAQRWHKPNEDISWITEADVQPDGQAEPSSKMTADSSRSSDLEYTPGPETEYSLMATVLTFWDEERFARICTTNFQTEEPLHDPPADFWRYVGKKLHLTADQIATFKGLKQLIQVAMTAMLQKLGESSRQQEVIIQQQALNLQLQRIQQEQLTTLHQQLGKQYSLYHQKKGELNQAHLDILAKQAGLLKQWYILNINTGLVTLNTLSHRQLAALIAASYPSISRMDTVMEFLDELQPAAAAGQPSN